jgi:hypothetical protein
MTIGLPVALRNSRLQALVDAIDLEGDEYGAGKLLIYSGTRPATGAVLDEYDDPILLVEFDLPYPCGTVSNGILTLGTIPDAIAVASGTATWARITDADDNFVADLSVTDTNGSGDVQIDVVVIEAAGIVHCHSAVITEGNV